MTQRRLIDLYTMSALGAHLMPSETAAALGSALAARRALLKLRRPDGCFGRCRARETGADHSRECVEAAAALGEG